MIMKNVLIIFVMIFSLTIVGCATILPQSAPQKKPRTIEEWYVLIDGDSESTYRKIYYVINVYSEPANAKVYVNDAPKGNTPFRETYSFMARRGHWEKIELRCHESYNTEGPTLDYEYYEEEVGSFWVWADGAWYGDSYKARNPLGLNVTVYLEGYEPQTHRFTTTDAKVIDNWHRSENEIRFELNWTAFLEEKQGKSVDIELDMEIHTEE